MLRPVRKHVRIVRRDVLVRRSCRLLLVRLDRVEHGGARQARFAIPRMPLPRVSRKARARRGERVVRRARRAVLNLRGRLTRMRTLLVAHVPANIFRR